MERLSSNINNSSTTSTPTAPNSSTFFSDKHDRSEKRSNSTTRSDKKDYGKLTTEKDKRSAGGLLNKLRRRDKDYISNSKDSIKEGRLRSTKSATSLLDLPPTGSISPTKSSDILLSPSKSNNMLNLSAGSTTSHKLNHLNTSLNSPTTISSPTLPTSVSSIFQFGYLSRKYEPVKPTVEPASSPATPLTPSAPHTSPPRPHRFVLATTTNETFTLIKITDITSLDVVKELILSKLGFSCSQEVNDTSTNAQHGPSSFDIRMSDFSFHLTDFGCTEGHALEDTILSNLILHPDKLGIPPSEPLRLYISGKWVELFNQKMVDIQKQIVASISTSNRPMTLPDFYGSNGFRSDSTSPGQFSLEFEQSTNTSHYPATPSHLINTNPKGTVGVSNDYFSHKIPHPENNNNNGNINDLNDSASHLQIASQMVPNISSAQQQLQVPILTQQQQNSFQEYIMNSHKGNVSLASGSINGSSSFSSPTGQGIPKSPTSSISSISAAAPPAPRSNSSVGQQEWHSAGASHHHSIPFSGAFGHFSNFASFVQQPGFSNANASNELTVNGYPGIPSYSTRDSIRSSIASIDYTGRRSSEDSFKVIRPERREINFDDRRASPYDRRRPNNGSTASATSAAAATAATAANSNANGHPLHLVSNSRQGSHVNTSVMQPGPGSTGPAELVGPMGPGGSHSNSNPSNKNANNSPMLYRGQQMARQNSKSDRRSSTQQFVARRNAPPPPSQPQQQKVVLNRTSSKGQQQLFENSQVTRSNSKRDADKYHLINSQQGSFGSKRSMSDGPKLTITTAPPTDFLDKSNDNRISSNSNKNGLVPNTTRRPSGEGVSDSTGKLSPKISPTSPAFDSRVHTPTTPTFEPIDPENNNNETAASSTLKPDQIPLMTVPSPTNKNTANELTPIHNTNPVSHSGVSDEDSFMPTTLNDQQKQILFQQQQNITPPQQSFNYFSSKNGGGPPRLDLKDLGSPGLSHDLALLGVLEGSPQSINSNNSNVPTIVLNNHINSHSGLDAALSFHDKRCSLSSVKEEDPPSPKSPAVALVRQPSVRMPHRSPKMSSPAQGTMPYTPQSASSFSSPEKGYYTKANIGANSGSIRSLKRGPSQNHGARPEVDVKFHENEISFEGAPELEDSSDDDSSSSDEGLWAKKPPKSTASDGASATSQTKSASGSISQAHVGGSTNSQSTNAHSIGAPRSKISADFDNGTDDEGDSDDDAESKNSTNTGNTKDTTNSKFFTSSKDSTNSKSSSEFKGKEQHSRSSTDNSHKDTQTQARAPSNARNSSKKQHQHNYPQTSNNLSTASAAAIQRNSQHQNQMGNHPQLALKISPSAAATARARPHFHPEVAKTRGYSVPASAADLGVLSRGGVVGKTPYIGNYLPNQQKDDLSSPDFETSDTTNKSLQGQSSSMAKNGDDSSSSTTGSGRTSNSSSSGSAGSKDGVSTSSSIDKLSFPDMNICGWAVRPPAEVVYENLERFFPDADLDRPIVLDPPGMSPPASPSTETSNTSVNPQNNSNYNNKNDNSTTGNTASNNVSQSNFYDNSNSATASPDSMMSNTVGSNSSFVEDDDKDFSSDRPSSISSVSSMNINRGAGIHTPLSPVVEPKKQNLIQQHNVSSGLAKENTSPVQLIQQGRGQAPMSQKQEKVVSSSQQQQAQAYASHPSQKSVSNSGAASDDSHSSTETTQQNQRPLSFASTHSNEVSFSKITSNDDDSAHSEGNNNGNNNAQRKGNFAMRTKSLRVVALEATERRKRFQSLANINTQNGIGGRAGSTAGGGASPSGVVMGGSPGALLRRKSTKMWGQKVVEVKPYEFRKGGSSQQLSRLRDNRGKVKQFVWVKGELIGKGTFGKVYLAFNVTAGEMIAVKQVDVPQTLSDKNSERQKEVIGALHAEVETMKDLDHFNIVQYLGFEALPDTYNLFLEYVPGGTVGMALRKNGRFETSVSQYFTRQVLDGLAYLHSCGILHRDLKSDNILIDLDGVCKISDFGISKKSRNIYTNDAEMSMQGTIFWMAPEVIHNVVDNEKQGYSAKVDIWSLGCVVLEMFAGRRPWSTDEAIGAMYKLGNARLAPPIPEDTKPFVTATGKNFLDLCFQTNPEQRPTAKQLLDHQFCAVDPNFRFADTKLAKMIRVDDKEKTKMRENKMSKR